jgi:uncharacterized LabA/DUF88 family protein
MKHKEQRVLVLFDTQNLYYSGKQLYGRKVNFAEILKTAVAGRRLLRAIAYVIKTDIKEESIFHDALNKIGIEVKQKNLQIFQGGAKKGDWDIGIAMDAVRLSPKVDTVVLVSGDGDFKDLIQYLKSHGCRAEVIGFGKTTSKYLLEVCDDYLDLSSNKRKYLIGSTGRRTSRDNHMKRNVDARRPIELNPEVTKQAPQKPVPVTVASKAVAKSAPQHIASKTGAKRT